MNFFCFIPLGVEANNGFDHLKLQSTPDNSNLLWKPKKIWVIVSSEQITGNKQMDGEGTQVSCILHFKGSKK